MKAFSRLVVICVILIYLSAIICAAQPAVADDGEDRKEWREKIREKRGEWREDRREWRDEWREKRTDRGWREKWEAEWRRRLIVIDPIKIIKEPNISTIGPFGVSMSLIGAIVLLIFNNYNFSRSLSFRIQIVRWLKLWKVFAVLISTIVILYYVVIHILGPLHYSFIAKTAGILLYWSGVNVFAEENSLFIPIGDRITQLVVGWECAAVVSYIVYVALVLALPGVDLKGRIFGLAFGVPAIFVTNILRIFFIAYGSYNYPSISLFVFHDFFGVPFAFFTMIAIWFVWFYYALFKRLTPEGFDSG